VIRIRGIAHVCPLIKTKMVVVEVVETPKPVGLTSRIVAKGLVLTYRAIDCHKSTCPYYKYCVVEGLREGEKIVIEDVLNNSIKCPRGLNIRLVSARRLAAFEEV